MAPPYQRRMRLRQRGFTLLEILVAVTVLGIALVSLLGLHARNIRLTAETQDMTRATMLAARLAAVTKAGDMPREGTIEGRFTANERESLRDDETYGGEGSERFVWTLEVENISIMPMFPPMRAITVSVGEPDQEPLAELRFMMASKTDVINALKQLGLSRNAAGDDR